MNKLKLVFLFSSLFPFLFSFICCGGTYTTNGDNKYVEYELRGIWECNTESFWPEGQTITTAKGRLVFDLTTVTITGPVAHLQGFTRDTALEAYTEEGKLYIKDKNAWQSPIAYIRWESGGAYPKDKLVTFQGNGVADETLKFTENNF